MLCEPLSQFSVLSMNLVDGLTRRVAAAGSGRRHTRVVAAGLGEARRFDAQVEAALVGERAAPHAVVQARREQRRAAAHAVADLVDDVRRNGRPQGRREDVAIRDLRARHREARERGSRSLVVSGVETRSLNVQEPVEPVHAREVVVDADGRVPRDALRVLLEPQRGARSSCRRSPRRAPCVDESAMSLSSCPMSGSGVDVWPLRAASSYRLTVRKTPSAPV